MSYDQPRIEVLLDQDEVRVVVLSGEFDIDNVEPVREVLTAAARDGVRRVVDVTRLVFADSSLLTTLLASRRDGPLVLAGPVPPQFAQLLRLSSAESVLEIAPTLDDARSFRPSPRRDP
ncbi:MULTISPECIES: STAS domain-containing protein [unclassified Streptomyces]|uniref:STAS domain-containing protein n=1 Tax=unclassified Streptomyces TaxID=2593676 RepID=UPI001BEA991B|nr:MULTISPECIES: STAS domain-containing protein [unclassified Streptomyces]MBT2406505.1 STAS domain-containing protein [Streptomyces sp. ISL-21]MBT2459846.1 STAS domain-containing protein [Streptomyces sp. ISL-86]MBT2608843.1 STAS domain-containing protein [Streptomyces sp. ISL-87]